MTYLILTADYRSTGVKNEFGDWLDRKTLILPEGLWDKIDKWVLDYAPIIQMDEPERNENINFINDLDSRGIDLAKLIQDCVVDCKVKYYSEGLLAFIHFNN